MLKQGRIPVFQKIDASGAAQYQLASCPKMSRKVKTLDDMLMYFTSCRLKYHFPTWCVLICLCFQYSDSCTFHFVTRFTWGPLVVPRDAGRRVLLRCGAFRTEQEPNKAAKLSSAKQLEKWELFRPVFGKTMWKTNQQMTFLMTMWSFNSEQFCFTALPCCLAVCQGIPEFHAVQFVQSVATRSLSGQLVVASLDFGGQHAWARRVRCLVHYLGLWRTDLVDPWEDAGDAFLFFPPRFAEKDIPISQLMSHCLMVHGLWRMTSQSNFKVFRQSCSKCQDSASVHPANIRQEMLLLGSRHRAQFGGHRKSQPAQRWLDQRGPEDEARPLLLRGGVRGLWDSWDEKKCEDFGNLGGEKCLPLRFVGQPKNGSQSRIEPPQNNVSNPVDRWSTFVGISSQESEGTIATQNRYLVREDGLQDRFQTGWRLTSDWLRCVLPCGLAVDFSKSKSVDHPKKWIRVFFR